MDHQLKGIAANLLEKSRRGEVKWQWFEQGQRRYSVQVPPGFLVIQRNPSEYPPASVTFSIHVPNEEDALSEWTVEEGEADWPLILELFERAEQKARGWDRVISDIERAVRAGGPIG